ncbi:KH domain-containing protein [Ditylenchus destructor]|nr:KH domain-containing protein [Ditylenchus destructor]
MNLQMNSSPHTSTAANAIPPPIPQQPPFPTPVVAAVQRPTFVNAQDGLPLKLVVNARYVGAIIGHGGQNIREISKFSKARCMNHMFVYSNDFSSQAGLPITIELKIRVPNQLVGRLIGKQGASVKKIMEETSSSISIRSNSIDAVSGAEKKISQKLRYYFDSDVSQGLVCHPMPTDSMNGLLNVPPFMGIAGRDGLVGAPGAYNNASAINPNIPPPQLYYPPINLPMNPYMAHNMAHHNPIHVQSRIFIPTSAIGSHIKNMMQLTGANIHIEGGSDGVRKQKTSDAGVKDNTSKGEPSTKDVESHVPLSAEAPANEDHAEQADASLETDANGRVTPIDNVESKNPNPDENEPVQPQAASDSDAKKIENDSSAENQAPSSSVAADPQKRANAENKVDRYVAISGLDFQVYRAQFWVFQRIAEAMHQFIDETILTCETMVPTRVRELQRLTGAQVKVPEDPTVQNDSSPRGETPVRVTGNLFSLHAVQARFSVLIAESDQRDEGKRFSRASTFQNRPKTDSNAALEGMSEALPEKMESQQ